MNMTYLDRLEKSRAYRRAARGWDFASDHWLPRCSTNHCSSSLSAGKRTDCPALRAS